MATRRNIPLATSLGLDPGADVGGSGGARRRRRGRPSESDGLTEQRILDAARVCFAESGYAATSTHAVAARVGLTTGALYHYFNAKRHLYLAVFRQVEDLVHQRFRAVAERQTTFLSMVGAVFDEVIRLNRSDPTLARFMAAVTADFARHAELREAGDPRWLRWEEFLEELVDVGVANGELAVGDRRVVVETINTMMVGLVGVRDLLPGAQARAVEGFKRLLCGMLIVKAPEPS